MAPTPLRRRGRGDRTAASPGVGAISARGESAASAAAPRGEGAAGGAGGERENPTSAAGPSDPEAGPSPPSSASHSGARPAPCRRARSATGRTYGVKDAACPISTG
jgi:hypothetical protein